MPHTSTERSTCLSLISLTSACGKEGRKEERADHTTLSSPLPFSSISDHTVNLNSAQLQEQLPVTRCLWSQNEWKTLCPELSWWKTCEPSLFISCKTAWVVENYLGKLLTLHWNKWGNFTAGLAMGAPQCSTTLLQQVSYHCINVCLEPETMLSSELQLQRQWLGRTDWRKSNCLPTQIYTTNYIICSAFLCAWHLHDYPQTDKRLN